jgi:hypothetical protein
VENGYLRYNLIYKVAGEISEIMNKSFGRAAALVGLVLSAALSMFGQATSGAITGSILDPAGAAVPNAMVSVENQATGVKTGVTSDASGVYRAANLLVGTYRITASAEGFTPASVENTVVELNVTATVNVALSVGSISSAVQVTEAASVIDTTTSQVTNVYNSQMASELPSTANMSGHLNGGLLNLSLLGSGVTSSGGIGVGIGPSVGGQRPRNNSFNIEGVDNNRKDVTGPATSVPPETVSEFTVIQNQFSAEYGHSSGGQFNTALLSGTNTIHGAMWEYFNNKNLDAIDQAFARSFVGITLPPAPRFDENRLGAMIGGPIKKNKLFYFGSYDYNPLGLANVPPSPIFSPTAAGYSALSSISSVSPALLGVMKQYVAPAPVQASGAAGNTTVCSTVPSATGICSGTSINIPIGVLPVNAPLFQNNYRWLAAVDYTISDRDQLRVRYVDNKQSTIDFVAKLPVFWQPAPTTGHIATVSEYHNFSPTVVNEFRAAYNRFVQLIPYPSDLTFPGVDTFPNIGINNDLSLNVGPNPSAPQNTYESTYQIVDNLSWTKGRHDLKFGFDGRDLMALSTFIQRQRGDYEYSTLDFFLHDLLPDQLAQRNIGVHYYSGNDQAYYFYVNDNWKVTHSLTLNLGLRYEYNGVAQSMRLFDANAIANTPGVLTFQAPKPQKTNFAPRFGFAYAPGNSASTSIRGGIGIAYDQVFDNVGTNATPPEASATVNAVSPAVGFLAAGGISAATPAVFTASTAKALTSSYLPPLQKQGYAITWNMSIQHVFAKDYTFEARYIGNRGVHLLFQTQLNRNSLVTPTASLPLFYSAPSAATLAGETYGLCPAGKATAAPDCLTVGGNQSALNNPLAAYGYTSSITAYEPLGNSSYHGLALQLTRRFSNGLSFQGAYTYSHLIDDSTSEVNSTALTPRRPQDFGNLSAEKASSALDHRQRLVWSSLYQVPWFSHSNSWAKRNILGNFRVGAIYTYETGEWVTPQSATDSNLNGDSAGDRVVINTSGIPGTSSNATAVTNANGATVGYLVTNPSAEFIKAPAGVYANSGRNILQTPPIDNIDFNLSKIFAYRERMRFEFRADFYNGLNHPQYTTGQINNTTIKQHIGETSYLTPGNPLFAQWDQVFSSNPRAIQLGAKFTF